MNVNKYRDRYYELAAVLKNKSKEERIKRDGSRLTEGYKNWDVRKDKEWIDGQNKRAIETLSHQKSKLFSIILIYLHAKLISIEPKYL